MAIDGARLPEGIVISELRDHVATIKLVRKSLVSQIRTVAEVALVTLQRGRKLLLMGNGGSAADAQHIAAELVGRFRADRAAVPAIALTTDTSILTAMANDFGFDMVFARQIGALAEAGDMVIGISTSGKSPNIIRGIEAANEKGCMTVGLTGRDGGELAKRVDLCVIVPAWDTARIQEAHITIGHIVCALVEQELHKKDRDA